MVLADAGYGVDTAFRDGITEFGLAYVVGIQSSTSLWPPGDGTSTAKALEWPRPSHFAAPSRR
jgi:SRSO17 transposase